MFLKISLREKHDNPENTVSEDFNKSEENIKH